MTERHGLGGDDIRCLFQDRSGTIWIGARLGGLTCYMGNAITVYNERSGLPSSKVTGFKARTDGGMFIQAGNDALLLPAENLEPTLVPVPPVPVQLRDAKDVLVFGDGHEWFATDHGVYDLRPDGSMLRVGRDTLEATALTMRVDSMLIGTHHGLYSVPVDNSAANWTRLFGAGDEDISCLTRDRADNIWIGTADRGLLRFNANGTQRWTERERIASDHIRFVLLDAYQNLWVGTDRGFDLLELDEMQEQVIDIKHFDREDGFPGIEAMPNACLLDSDSALWFGTTRGAIRFDPWHRLDDPYAPNTRITDIKLFFEHPDWRRWCDTLSASGLPVGLRLPHDQNHLTFSFSGLSLVHPERVRFQYKLEGRDADWSPITEEDHLTYSGLEPGNYTFLVKARNGSGVWNDEPARFNFSIVPPFWNTNLFRFGTGTFLVMVILLLQRLRERRSRRARERLERIVKARTQELADEKHRSDSLLLNILPETTAAELKERGTAQARHYSECTVLFSDFQGFTVLSEQLEATGIVTELDRFFRAFDRITDKYATEKIKTIGDAYMCASGVPEPSPTHALDAVLMALEMLDVVDGINHQRVSDGHPAWPIRIGLHSGPLIAGVVGEKKFAYDVWGDTVNLASRMESSGAPGRINVSAATVAQVTRFVEASPRGPVTLKGKGEVECWFIDRLKPQYSADERGHRANDALLKEREALRQRA